MLIDIESVYDKYKYDVYPFLRPLRGSTKLLSYLERLYRDSIVVQKRDEELEFVFEGHSYFVDSKRTLDHLLWEKRFLERFVRELSEDMVVADVGAFRGLYSLLASNRVKRVDAFEPDPGNFEILKKNCGELSSVNLVMKAVWKNSCELALDNSGDTSVVMEKEDGGIDAVSLDDYYAGERAPPDIIKIDVEGAEKKVLSGASEIISENSPIIFLEEHSEQQINRFGDTQYELHDFFANLNYYTAFTVKRNDEHLRILKRE
jgi:FkbM family methyltransferase